MEKFVNEILNDEIIVNIYSEIDRVSNFSSSHGLRHIKNTLKLAEKLENIFNIPQRDRLLIETSLVLHDIGQINGRENHGARSKIFAKKYLPEKNVFNADELKTIYSAIENHDECKNLYKLKTNIAWFVNLIDKLDFSHERLEENYKEKFKYSIYEEIDHLDFNLMDDVFKIDIKLIDNSNAKIEKLFDRVLFSKATYIFENFCKKFNLQPKIYLENDEVNLNLLDMDKIAIQ